MSNEQTIEKKTFEVTKELIENLVSLINEKRVFEINNALHALHPSDAAEVLSNLPEKARFNLLLLEALDLRPDTVKELNNTLQKDILNQLPSDNVAEIVNQLESDDALQIVSNLDEEKKIDVYEKIPLQDKKLLEEVLKAYPEDSAARIMQTEYCSVSPEWTVGETIDYLRETVDLPKEFLQIFVVDDKKRPLGSVPSSRVLRNPRSTKMRDIMDETQMLIYGDWDKEQVGYCLLYTSDAADE